MTLDAQFRRSKSAHGIAHRMTTHFIDSERRDSGLSETCIQRLFNASMPLPIAPGGLRVVCNLILFPKALNYPVNVLGSWNSDIELNK